MSDEVVIEQLSKRVIKSSFWVFTLRATQQIFNIIRLIILARLLSPKDFGLIGIALLAMAMLETFSATGFQQALIQKKDNIESYLNSAWTILIVRGFILFGVLYLSAPYVAAFFDSPDAKLIIRVIGLSLLFQAFTNIGVTYFQRELEFNKQFLYELSGTLADFVVAILAALILRNVWAIVISLLVGDFVRCLASYFIHPYRPKISLDWGKIKELWKFGRWILGSSILIFLVTQGDDIFVGKMLGVAALGFYQMAYRISNTAATEITHTVIKVTFPAFSKLQDSLALLREGFLKVVRIVSFFSFPIAGAIFALAHNFTVTVLGAEWKPIVALLMIFVFQAAIRSIRGILGSVVNAIGYPDVETRITLIQVLIIALLVYPATLMLGVSGVAIVIVFQTLATFPILLGQILPKLELSHVDFIKVLMLPFLATLIMVGVIFAAQSYLSFSILTLGLEIFLGIIVYLGFSFLCLKLGIFSETFNDLRSIRTVA